MFFIGGTFAVLCPHRLLTPEGDLFAPETYNKLVHHARHHHDLLLPDPVDSGDAGKFSGADDDRRARPGLSAHEPAELVLLRGRRRSSRCFAVLAGGVDTGWTFYTPYSTTYSNTWVIAAALGIFIAGFSSILTGLNFIVTVHSMRAPGMTWFRMPLFVWANYATA